MSDAFAPPESQALTSDGPIPVDAPGVAGALTVVPPTMLSAAKLLLDGEPVASSWGKYKIPMDDGREVEAGFQAALTDSIPTLVVDGVSYKLGEPIPMGLAVMAFLPLVLVFMGGALGGGIGAVGWIANRKISLLKIHWGLRALGILAATGVTIVGYFALAVVVTLAIGGG